MSDCECCSYFKIMISEIAIAYITLTCFMTRLFMFPNAKHGSDYLLQNTTKHHKNTTRTEKYSVMVFFLFGVIYDHKIKIKYWFVYIQLDTTFYSTKAKTLKQTSLLQRMLFLFLSNILALSEPDDGNAKKILHYINNIKTK